MERMNDSMRLKYAVMAAVVLIAGTALLLALVPSVARNEHAAGKEFTLIAQDMKFHLQDEAGQPLTARVGERIRLIIRNEEAQPIAHNFVLVGLGLRTGYLQPGDFEVIEFVAARQGYLLYACLLHPGIMDGQIHILP
jgi:hypothetical protein